LKDFTELGAEIILGSDVILYYTTGQEISPSIPYLSGNLFFSFFYNPCLPPAALKKIETVNVYFIPNAIKVAVFKQLQLKQRTRMVS